MPRPTQIFFGTTNEGKIKEATRLLNIEVIPSGLKIDEIQTLDPVEVATKKTQAYFSQLKKPVLTEDVSLFFNGLKGLPGPYINDFSKALGNRGLIDLLTNNVDRSAVAQTTLGYADESGEVHIFEGQIKGSISDVEKGTNGFGWDTIFIPHGFDKTFAEMTDEQKNSCSMRALAFEKLGDWLSGV